MGDTNLFNPCRNVKTFRNNEKKMCEKMLQLKQKPEGDNDFHICRYSLILPDKGKIFSINESQPASN